jgi:hypothetical protein
MGNYEVEKKIDKTAKRVDIKADYSMLTRNKKGEMTGCNLMSCIYNGI